MLLDYSLIDAKDKLDKIINCAIENHTPIKIHLLHNNDYIYIYKKANSTFLYHPKGLIHFLSMRFFYSGSIFHIFLVC